MNKTLFLYVLAALSLTACQNDDFGTTGGGTIQPGGNNTGGGGNTATTTAALFSQYEGTATELTGTLSFTDFSNFSIAAGATAPTSTETIQKVSEDGTTIPDNYEDFVENFLFDADTKTWETSTPGVKSIEITYSGDGVSCQYKTKKGKAKGDPFSTTTTLTEDGETEAIVTIDGAHVTVQAYKKYNFVLSGTSSDGSFKLYPEKKCEVTLNGVNLTNTKGAAINIQEGSDGDKRCYLIINEGTTNTLSDGSSYSTTDGEDEKGVIFNEGKILISGTGTLNITANGKNGIASDDYVYLHEGPTINITQKTCNDGILVMR